jgi:hypothetical protein
VKTRVDSITFSKKELEFAINKMQRPEVARWDSGIFPNANFITKKKVDSFFTPRRLIGSEAYERRKQEILWSQGYWKFSNPVFLKNGTFALVFYWNYRLSACVSYYLNVYKIEDGKWHWFGRLWWGNMN